MADIQIVGAEVVGPFLFIARTVDGARHLQRMPKETLAIRAAEYGLEPDDPFVLEMVLHEHLIEPEDQDELHPLFAAPSIAKARTEMRARVTAARDAHGAPKGKLRALAAAIDAGTATAGAGEAAALLLQHADPRVAVPMRALVAAERDRVAAPAPSLVESLERQAAELESPARVEPPEPIDPTATLRE